MEKMNFETVSGEEKNIALLAGLFPNCVTEGMDQSGNLVKKVNFELLKQMLSADMEDFSNYFIINLPVTFA